MLPAGVKNNYSPLFFGTDSLAHLIILPMGVKNNYSPLCLFWDWFSRTSHPPPCGGQEQLQYTGHSSVSFEDWFWAISHSHTLHQATCGMKHNCKPLDIALSLLGLIQGHFSHISLRSLWGEEVLSLLGLILGHQHCCSLTSHITSLSLESEGQLQNTGYWSLLFWRPGSGSPGLMQSLWDEQLLLEVFGVKRTLIMEHFIQFLPPLSQSHTYTNMYNIQTQTNSHISSQSLWDEQSWLFSV